MNINRSNINPFCALAVTVFSCLAIGCSPQGNNAKNHEPTAEKKAAGPSPSPTLPNVVGCDWGAIHQTKEKLDLTVLKQAGMETVECVFIFLGQITERFTLKRGLVPRSSRPIRLSSARTRWDPWTIPPTRGIVPSAVPGVP